MSEEKQTLPADAPEVTVPTEQVIPEVGQVDADKSVGSTDPLKVINETTGRDFKSLDEYKEHYDNLNSLVGDQSVAQAREASERWSKMLEEVKPLAEAEGVSPESYLEYSLKQAKENVPELATLPPEPTGDKTLRELEAEKIEKERWSKVEAELEELKAEKYKNNFLKENPEAEKYYDDFVSWAKGKGVEPDKNAYTSSPFKELVDADRQEAGTSTIETNSRLTGDRSNYEKDYQTATKTGDWESFLAKYVDLKNK